MNFEFDLKDCYSPDDVMQLIEEKLPLPEYFGGNLDALYDAFSDPHERYDITFLNVKAASVNIGEKYIKRLKRMCENAKESGNLSVTFLD